MYRIPTRKTILHIAACSSGGYFKELQLTYMWRYYMQETGLGAVPTLYQQLCGTEDTHSLFRDEKIETSSGEWLRSLLEAPPQSCKGQS